MFPSFFVYLYILSLFQCIAQDPWDYEKVDFTKHDDDRNIPPDLRMKPKTRTSQSSGNLGTGEYFYKRILGIVIRGGHVEESEDGSIEISLKMKLDQKQVNTLQEYISTTSPLNEDDYRRSLGYVEESIYKPHIAAKVVLTTTEYIQGLLTDYKTELTWTLAILAALTSLYYIWIYMSHKSALILIFIVLYAYEVYYSYKEAEQKEIDLFIAAVDRCSWYFWSSTCELPKPNPLLFLKHMNPLKIAIRMCTSVISEPILVLSDTMKTVTHGVTDGLVYPLNIIANGVIYTTLIFMLLIMFISILYNYILNIPINLSFGLFRVGFRQRERTIFNTNQNQTTSSNVNNTNALNGATVGMLESGNASSTNTNQQFRNMNRRTQRQITNDVWSTHSVRGSCAKRSSSTGRLPSSRSSQYANQPFEDIPFDGAGDRWVRISKKKV